MIAYIIESSICLGVSLLSYYLFFARAKYFHFNRAYLIFTLFLSFLIPFVDVEFRSDSSYFEIDHFRRQVAAPFSSDLEIKGIDVESEQGFNVINNSFLLMALYLLGMLFMFIRYSKNIFRLWSIIKNEPSINRGNYKIVLIDHCVSPFSFLGYIFVNKNEYEGSRIPETIFTHELVHVREYHSIDVLLIEFLLILFYFNPIVWLYRQTLRFNHEYTADQKVLEQHPDEIQYAKDLIHFTYSNSRMFECSFNSLSTKKRLIMIAKQKTNKLIFGNKVALTILLLLVTTGMLSFKNIQMDATLKGMNVDEITVVIDLAHGTRSPGAKSNDGSLDEVSIVNAIGDQIKLIDSKVRIIFTRENNEHPSIEERTNLATESKADLLLSLHINAHPTNRKMNGIAVFYSEENSKSNESKAVADFFVQRLKFRNGGAPNALQKANFIVLRQADVPSVLLELGYISNQEDLSYLLDLENQKNLARQIVRILEEWPLN